MSERATVLIADDETNLRHVLRRELERAGHLVLEAANGEQVLERLRAGPAMDVVLLDLKMPGKGGLETLRELRKAGHGAEVIVLTGHGTIPSVVEAMKLGAFDYLPKPCGLAELEVLVARAIERRRARSLSAAAPGGAPAPRPPSAELEIVASSPAMMRTLALADRAAPSGAPVLIEGETGVGKELLARRIHARSAVAGGPFVIVNCGALEPNLLISELFGHERGAFTGAERQKRGLFELADSGTLFLDELGELPLEAQVRLLRFLQFGELRRLGGSDLLRVTVRVIAATNRRLSEEVAAGAFREDLYYRLNTIELRIPPLRERRDEIPALLARFLDRVPGGTGRTIAPDALALLVEYAWPGNARELENVVARLAILCDGPTIDRAGVVEHFQALGAAEPTVGRSRRLRDIEREEIVAALARHGGDKQKVADELGISLKTVYNKIKAYGLGEGPRRDAGRP